MAGNPSPGLHVLCLTKTFIDVYCVPKQKDPLKSTQYILSTHEMAVQSLTKRSEHFQYLILH